MSFTHTEESKRRLSEMRKGSGNPFYGRKHSPETIAKMKEKARTNPVTRQYEIAPCNLKNFSSSVGAYVAGMIDGDGSITHHRQTQVVYVYNCEECLMRWLVSNIGGSYRVTHNNGREPNLIWTVGSASNVFYLLVRIRKYLVIKQGRADDTIRYLRKKYGDRLNRKEASSNG